jgi:hypothetical protein
MVSNRMPSFGGEIASLRASMSMARFPTGTRSFFLEEDGEVEVDGKALIGDACIANSLKMNILENFDFVNVL